MIAVDASVVAAFVLREEGWENLGAYLKRAVSVDFLVGEVANAVWKACCVRGFLTPADAEKALALFKLLLGKNIVLRPSLDYLDRAFEISLKEKLPVYDSLYIALAVAEKVPLATLDEKQRGVAEKLGVEVRGQVR